MANERKGQDQKDKRNRIEDPVPRQPEIEDPDMDEERADRDQRPGQGTRGPNDPDQPRHADQDRGSQNPDNPAGDPERTTSTDRQGNR